MSSTSKNIQFNTKSLRINIANVGSPQWVILRGDGEHNIIDETTYTKLQEYQIIKDLIIKNVIVETAAATTTAAKKATSTTKKTTAKATTESATTSTTESATTSTTESATTLPLDENKTT